MFVVFFILLFTYFNVQYVNASEPKHQRFSGKNRILTSISVSQQGWPLGLDNAGKIVIIARADQPSDALAASGLAGVKESPILLTYSNKIPTAVTNEIKRLNAKSVYVLGGTGAVNEEVVKELRGISLNVIRIYGHDRFETANNINKIANLYNNKEAILANGITIADALSASSVSAINKIPVYLTTKDKLEVSLSETIETVYIFGGTNAISQEVENELIQKGKKVIRFSGKDRFETSLNINKHFNPNVNNLLLVKGLSITSTNADYPDAVTAGGLAKRYNAKTVLLNPEKYIQEVDTLLKSKPHNLLIMGGDGAIPNKLLKEYGIPTNKIESWPVVNIESTYTEIVNRSLSIYHENNYDDYPYLQDYKSLGD
jgi:putative cell wall-binding protein